MTLKTRVSADDGIVETSGESGFSVERNSRNYGFAPYKVDSINQITSSTTLGAGDAGVITVSGSSALTITMPPTSECPGAEFMIRTTSAHAHILTASQETPGRKAFTDGGNSNSKVTLNNIVGSAVVLKCDGNSFFILSVSGAIVYG